MDNRIKDLEEKVRNLEKRLSVVEEYRLEKKEKIGIIFESRVEEDKGIEILFNETKGDFDMAGGGGLYVPPRYVSILEEHNIKFKAYEDYEEFNRILND